ncbi:LacI family DNA-binding transcriptional regulator [uncultured Corynebacterium sp.]|uniref:LacI family DNA-binding transcriptional regulator n=1 Tax=uncultured Corynebacterium sp. TaxID=159447 RepID=UPI0025F261D8|nr:LacI family DNA-binding transcriptional regulator [uncultured Corynebacterium sp.]
MNSTANLKDVAAAAGVSVSTASRALAGKPTISAATRARVREAAQRLHYSPNIQARGLRTAKTYTIGLAIPTLVNPFFATMAAAIQENAGLKGFSTIITAYNEDPAALTSAVDTLYQHQVDGMIIVPSTTAAAQLRQLTDVGLPVVLIDRALEGSDLPAVVSDPQPGIAAAVDALVQAGHTRIGFLAGPGELSTGAGRLAAFLAAREAHPALTPEPELVYYGGFEVTQGRQGARALLDAGATAIIAGDSMMSLGVLEHCYAAGVGIGSSLALVGFDDLVYMRVQPRPISVVDQDVVEMGHQALRLLLDWMDGSSPPRGPTTIPTRFIARASSDCAPNHTTSSPLPDTHQGGVHRD